MSIPAIELAYGWGVVIPRSQYPTVPRPPNGFIKTGGLLRTNPGISKIMGLTDTWGTII
jgi:hypothetical protein